MLTITNKNSETIEIDFLIKYSMTLMKEYPHTYLCATVIPRWHLNKQTFLKS